MKLALALFPLTVVVQASNVLAGKHSSGYKAALDAATEAAYLLKRGAPDAPNGYTPESANCPNARPAIRAATELSDQESSWRSTRIPRTIDAMRELLGRLNIEGLDTSTYLDNNQNDAPVIGIAFSGGGYRALMNGAGALAAFDDRTDGATSPGQLGGLLQSSLYIAGLSGGGWLVGSIYQNNFTSVQQIMNGDLESTWDFTNSIFKGPDHGIQLFTSAEYYSTLGDQVSGKEDAGFNITVTDYWGRALAFQLINAEDGGPAYTWSSMADGSYITGGDAPMPIVIANGRRPGTLLIPDNTTIFEFTPWEMGSWDPTVYGFAPVEYVGSNFDAGTLPRNEDCIRGFDSASFVMGTSSSLFNQFALQIGGVELPAFVNEFLTNLLSGFTQSEEDIASWVNPFYNYHPDTNPGAADRQLTLVDGGENNENIPFHPLIQPVRAVDVIFAIDSSADTEFSWPNGSALVTTYERLVAGTLANHTAFPSIPDTNTFINLGLNTRPTFFGCDGSNETVPGYRTTGPNPLIVYLPNSPYTAYSNVSTFNLSYETTTRNEIITNGYNVATQGNGTASGASNWPTCVGCAILRRSLERTSTDFPDVCSQCFTDYCWNGTLAANTPTSYQPDLKDLSGSNNDNGSGGNGSGGNDDGDGGDDSNTAPMSQPQLVWSAVVAASIALAAVLI